MVDESVEARTGWTPPARERWTEQDGWAMAKALARSGETVGAFARRHGLREYRVYTWKRRFAGQVASKSTPPAFVPVVVKAAPAPEAASVRASGLELVLRGGHTVRVGHDFDASLLRRVAAVFEREASC